MLPIVGSVTGRASASLSRLRLPPARTCSFWGARETEKGSQNIAHSNEHHKKEPCNDHKKTSKYMHKRVVLFSKTRARTVPEGVNLS